MFCLCMFSFTFSIDGRTRSSRGLCWRSWAALGAYVGGLGAYVGGLGPMLAVLGRSWGLFWRSWAALGAYVRGLGSGSGPKLAVLGPKWSVLEAIRAKSGPNPSGKAIWQADQAGKWPKPEREGDQDCGAPPGAAGAAERPEARNFLSSIDRERERERERD